MPTNRNRVAITFTINQDTCLGSISPEKQKEYLTNDAAVENLIYALRKKAPQIESVDVAPLLTPAEVAAKEIQQIWPYGFSEAVVPRIVEVIEKAYATE